MTTAAIVTAELYAMRDDAELVKMRRYFTPGPDDEFIGVRMGAIFDLAKRFVDLPVDQLEILLESPVHEVRVSACSIMGKSASSRRSSVERRAALYELYLRRSDRINSWDLVDLAAQYVLGGWLADTSREPLYRLVRSAHWPDRRSALLATAFFLRQGEVDDALALSEAVIGDDNEYVVKAAGWMLRVAGDVDRPALEAFLDRNAAIMPRVMLGNALEHFDAESKARYRALRT